MINPTTWQVPIRSLPDKRWDVVIVGAGPAGATAGTRLARRGYSVLILDRHCFPRDKTCGDILIPDALRALERLGLLSQVKALGQAIHIASIHSPSRIEVAIACHCLTLRRLHLDAMLARSAVQSGATLCQAQVDALRDLADGLTCVCSDGTRIRARVGLIATGANVELLGRQNRSSCRGTAIALRQYIRSPFPLDRLIFAYDRTTVPGYAWIAPLGDGVFNVGCGVPNSASSRTRVNLRVLLHRFTTHFPLARDLMRGSEVVSPLRGAMLRCGLQVPDSPGFKRVLAIGETIGATYPFSGEGIGKAMETAELAADVVHSALQSNETSLLGRFTDQLETELRSKYAAYEAAQRWLSHPWLNDLVMSRVRRSRFLQQAFAGVVEETVGPQTIFSVGGLLRSVWS